MVVQYGVELFVLVKDVLGETYVLLKKEPSAKEITAGAAREVVLLHVGAAADGDGAIALTLYGEGLFLCGVYA